MVQMGHIDGKVHVPLDDLDKVVEPKPMNPADTFNEVAVLRAYLITVVFAATAEPLEAVEQAKVSIATTGLYEDAWLAGTVHSGRRKRLCNW
jgi:hypothetical protein